MHQAAIRVPAPATRWRRARLGPAAVVLVTLCFGSWPVASSPVREEGEVRSPIEVRVPPEMELGSLPERAEAQRAEARGWRIPHAFGFTDRLSQSGITFRHRIVDDAGLRYKAVHYDHGNGVAAADVDGDQRIDLYFTSQLGGNELWRNLGGGRFENVTERAGVGLPDRVSVTASFADVDSDGDADLFVTTVRGGNALFLNDGTGQFRDATADSGLAYSGHSSAALFFDYDNDGRLDLFLTNVGVYTIEERGRGGAFVGIDDAFRGNIYPERAESSVLYRNLGEARFADVSSEALLLDRSWSGDATPIDFDQDGFQDLYVLNMQGEDHYYQNVGGQFFADRTTKHFPRTPPGTMGVKVFDWNRDGHLDLLLTDMHSDMLENVGPEREKDKAEPLAGGAAAMGTGGILGNALFQGTGEAAFREVSDAVGAETYWPWGISVADLNADGWEDVFVTASMNYPFRYGINSVLLNDRGRRFVDAEFVLGVEPRPEPLQPWFEVECPPGESGGEASPESMEAWKVFSEPGGAPGEVPGEVAGGRHADCGDAVGTVVVVAAKGSRSSVVFDLDSDGDLDVVTNEFNGPPRVLISDLAATDPGVRYVGVSLQGTRSNRDGLGARVVLVTNQGSHLRVHDGKSGYLSQSRLPLYFGLAPDEEPVRLEVRWPSGLRQSVEALEMGELRLVVEDPGVEGGGSGPEGEAATGDGRR